MTETQFYRRGRMASGRRSLQSISQDLQSFTNLSQDFWLSAFDLGTAMVDETLQWMGDRNTSGMGLLRPRRVCDVPQYRCPDPHLGDVVRQAYVGETIRVPLRVKNKTAKARTFWFAAEPLENVQGEVASALSLSPSQYVLTPQQTRLLDIGLTVSADAFKPGFDYSTTIVITSEGCEPQLLGFTLRVMTEDAAPLIKLGCPCRPSVRRIRWYDHFYCDVEADEKGDRPSTANHPSTVPKAAADS